MNVLESQLKNKSLSNAYIIEGEDEDYNLDFSKDFAAKVFNCPVGDINNNPDFYLIDKDPIDIKTIRKLIRDMVTRPYTYDFKVYIIHRAQNMRIEAANAMLKSLEELKDYVLIIFTTSNSQALLKTIRSRCQLVSLGNKKEDLDIDLRKLSEIGSEVFSGSLEAYFKNKDFLMGFKDDKYTLIEGLVRIFQDALDKKYKGKTFKDKSYAYNIDKFKGLDLLAFEKIFDRLSLVENSFRNNINFELSIENIFLMIYKEGRDS